MRKRYKVKNHSCALCKPNKMGAACRWKIKELSQDQNVVGKMVDSIAPSIFGYEKIKEALKELQRAARLVSDDPIIREHLGDVYYELKMYKESMREWKESLELKPESEAVKKKLTDIERILGPGKE